MSKLVIGLMALQACLVEASGCLLVTSLGLEDLQALVAVADNSFLDYLAIVKDGVIVLVLAEVLSYVCTKIMEKDDIGIKEDVLEDLF